MKKKRSNNQTYVKKRQHRYFHELVEPVYHAACFNPAEPRFPDVPFVTHQNDVCPHMHGVKVDGVVLMVPCGKCAICRRKVANEWACRLNMEKYVSAQVVCGTLTYEDAFLPLHGCEKKHIQLFLKRLRYYLEVHGFPSQFRYYVAAEYGPCSTHRLHYHFILFFKRTLKKSQNELGAALNDAWSCGAVSIDNTGSVSGYLTNYICGDQIALPWSYPSKNGGFISVERNKPFHMYSKGLGLSALANHCLKPDKKNCHTITIGSKHFKIPKYYVKKLNLDGSFTKACRPYLFADFVAHQPASHQGFYTSGLVYEQEFEFDGEKRIKGVSVSSYDIREMFNNLDLGGLILHTPENYSAIVDYTAKVLRAYRDHIQQLVWSAEDLDDYGNHVAKHQGYYLAEEYKRKKAMQDKHWKEPKKKEGENSVSFFRRCYEDLTELPRRDRRKADNKNFHYKPKFKPN